MPSFPKKLQTDFQKIINRKTDIYGRFFPIICTAGFATNAVVGSAILPTIGYASIAAAAGSLAAVASAAATGGAILLIPHYLLARAIANNFAHKPILHFCLQTALAMTTAICSGLLGAAILGMAVNPIGLCLLAGTITFALAQLAVMALIIGLIRYNAAGSKLPADGITNSVSVAESPSAPSVYASSIWAKIPEEQDSAPAQAYVALN